MTIEPPADNPPDDHGNPMWCGGCKFFTGDDVGGLCRGPLMISMAVGARTDLLGNQQPVIGSFYGNTSVGGYCYAFKHWSNRPPLRERNPVPQSMRLPVAADGASPEPAGAPPPLFLPDSETEGNA